MPFYDYACESCQTVFEELTGAGAPPPPCPKCASEQVQRKIPNTFAVGRAQPKVPATPCGRPCGDPRGPGACGL